VRKYKPAVAGLIVFIAALLASSDAHAMHIAEGILPFEWSIVWYVAAAPFVALGIYRLGRLSRTDLSMKPLVGLMAAAVFIISCMPVPIPTVGTCSHPCGTGLAAILLGPAISVLVATVALLIQALFLAHGGLSTLGANVLTMGVVGSFSGYAVFRGLRALKAGLPFAGFMAGIVADWATYAATAAVLAMGLKGNEPFMPLFTKIALAFVPTQLPLGILEGAMTAGMVVFLGRKRPDILVKMRVLRPEEARKTWAA
jgi:cobalt/nickel transport system permease protein